MNIPFEIVFSRFNEDVSFLEKSPHPVVVYNKGEPLPASFRRKVVTLPNVGMDSHSILTHLANNYDDLADVTLFICGSWRKRPENVYPLAIHYVVKPMLPGSTIVCARHVFDDGWPGPVKHWGKWADMLASGEIAKSPYTLGEWWDRVIGGPRPDKLCYCPGQTFSVCEEHVRRRPQEWYRQLAKYFERAKYPEECHHLERSWFYVFQEGGRTDVDL